MRFDVNLAREIMLAVERSEDHPLSVVKLDMPNRSPREVAYHVMQLHKARFIEALDRTTFGADGFNWAPRHLTWRGHQFLAAARDEKIWREVLSRLDEMGKGVSIETLETVLVMRSEQTAMARMGLTSTTSRKVFIVHGHDAEVRETTARFIERLGLDPIILHEQANRGRTIIEKFEQQADVGFVIVLLTPDDVGGPVGGEQKPRARQNIILELGYFIGRVGRERVCPLMKGEIELPSDILGIVWTPLDPGGSWRLKLAQELKAVGFEIDLNKTFAS